MNVGELRRYLGTLPLDSDHWPVVTLDGDTADLSNVHKLSVGTVDGGPALVLGVTLSEE